ncbi:MAG: hypothetical protein ACTS3F_09650 [Phycisphaerales bacterium]
MKLPNRAEWCVHRVLSVRALAILSASLALAVMSPVVGGIDEPEKPAEPAKQVEPSREDPKPIEPRQDEPKPGDEKQDAGKRDGSSGSPSDPEQAPEPAPGSPGGDPLPSLDELLDLVPPKEDGGIEGPAVSPEPERGDLERALEGESAGDDFTIAVRRMDEVATRLDELDSADLVSVRIQDEILARLDKVIEQAEQQQQQQQQQSQQQGQQPKPQNQNQQQSSQQQQQSGEQRDGDNSSEGTPPGARDPELRESLDAAQAAWGNLPERVRQTLLEGVDERFSDLYQSLTESYYRRLAGQEREQDSR